MAARLRSFRAKVKFDEPEGVPGNEVRGHIELEALEDIKVQSLSAAFLLQASGSGETEVKRYGGVEILPSSRKVTKGERFEANFAFALPDRGPISFVGEHVQIGWMIRLDCKLRWAFDQIQDFGFRVVPRQLVVPGEEEEAAASAEPAAPAPAESAPPAGAAFDVLPPSGPPPPPRGSEERSALLATRRQGTIEPIPPASPKAPRE